MDQSSAVIAIENILNQFGKEDQNSILCLVKDKHGFQVFDIAPDEGSDEWSKIKERSDVLFAYEEMRGKDIFQIILDESLQRG